MAKQDQDEHRGKQLAVGGLILIMFSAAIISLLLFWRFIPGWLGESFGMLAGIISTPFFLESSFAIMGLAIVVTLNSWRRKHGGDEYVEVEEKDLPVKFRSGSE